MDISVVVPVYGCAPCLAELHARLTVTLQSLDLDWEIILVDDSSTDHGWEAIEQLALSDHRVTGYRLDSNYGQVPAICAGATKARGGWLLTLDCDLQDPPEILADMWRQRADRDAVLLRVDKSAQGLRRIALSRIFNLIQRIFLRAPLTGVVGNFCLARADVIEAYFNSRFACAVYMLGILECAQRPGFLEYTKARRPQGASSYTLRALIRASLKQLSVAPWKITVYGLLLAVAMCALILNYVNIPGAWIAAGLLTAVLGSVIISIWTLYYRRLNSPFRIAASTGWEKGKVV